MKNLIHTQSIAWAHGIRVALEAEGIQATILDEHDRSGLGALLAIFLIVFGDREPGPLIYSLGAVVVLLLIAGASLIALGPQADKPRSPP